MIVNMSPMDRAVRLVAAAAIVILYASGMVGGTWGLVLVLFAAVFLLTGLVGFCPLYAALHWSSWKPRGSRP